MTAPLAGAQPAPLLLDTHVFLWWAEGVDERITPASRAAILAAPAVFVSIASAWELTIKTALGKMRLGVTFAHALSVNNFAPLPIALHHVDRVAGLPLHHRDPFDRMLAAQAIHEGLTLVTHDRAFAEYWLPVLWT